jgi:hypothetical protein
MFESCRAHHTQTLLYQRVIDIPRLDWSNRIFIIVPARVPTRALHGLSDCALLRMKVALRNAHVRMPGEVSQRERVHMGAHRVRHVWRSVYRSNGRTPLAANARAGSVATLV